jgi:hypothetical protein
MHPADHSSSNLVGMYSVGWRTNCGFGFELSDRINRILGDTERLLEILRSLQLLNPGTFDRIQRLSAITTQTTTAALPAQPIFGDENPILGDENPIFGDENPILGDEIRIAARHQDRGRSRIRFTARDYHIDLVFDVEENIPRLYVVFTNHLNNLVRWSTIRIRMYMEL